MTHANGKLNGHMRERFPMPDFRRPARAGADGAPRVSPLWADIEGECAVVDTSEGR
ncbi:hypothetical protein [Streptomyces sp. NRRL B-1140]|uniref:hypothetical protein n=1 Tax=Streptomyces sp. NRRL B-1140 TaxID=1415549 RepID=UPI000AE58F95|nr:hypothetical protein [Streptomyces sp. NRRL B-1140]